MKKSILFFFLWGCLSFLSGQSLIFTETCGSTDVTSSKKVDTYTGWDNSYPITYSRTTTLDGYADVRTTSSTTNHVWFPADKSSDLIISNIPAADYKNLKLSFDIAAYKLTDAAVNKLSLYCNDNSIPLPSTILTSQKFVTVSGIPLPDQNVITLKFDYTAENNPNGYRLDNFKITGEKETSDIKTPIDNAFSPVISGNTILFPAIPDGTAVELYNPVGIILQSCTLQNASMTLDSRIMKGLYILRIGKKAWKIIF